MCDLSQVIKGGELCHEYLIASCLGRTRGSRKSWKGRKPLMSPSTHPAFQCHYRLYFLELVYRKPLSTKCISDVQSDFWCLLGKTADVKAVCVQIFETYLKHNFTKLWVLFKVNENETRYGWIIKNCLCMSVVVGAWRLIPSWWPKPENVNIKAVCTPRWRLSNFHGHLINMLVISLI